MQVSDIVSVVSAVVALGSLYYTLRKLPTEARVMDTQGMANAAKSFKDMVDALLATSADRNKLELRVDELEAHRDQRTKELANLQQQNEDLQANQIATERKIEGLNREYTKQITTLREQVASWEARYNEIKERYNKAIEILVNVLDDEKREKVLPELALLLGDSISKFKLPRGNK